MTAILKKVQTKGVRYSKQDFDKIGIYCFAWALGGLFESEDREKLQKLLEQINSQNLPQVQGKSIDKETVFDYYFNIETMDWKLWEAESWVPPKKLEFSQLLIPTMDSTRANYLIGLYDSLPLKRYEPRKEDGIRNSLLVGGPGTAKTSCILMYISKFDTDKML